jgi:hypothetical protein
MNHVEALPALTKVTRLTDNYDDRETCCPGSGGVGAVQSGIRIAPRHDRTSYDRPRASQKKGTIFIVPLHRPVLEKLS